MTTRYDDADADEPNASPPSQPEQAAQPASFEESLGRLADLVAKLESGSLGLSASIDGYEQGVAILRRLHEELARAEERVSVLVRIDEEGRPVVAPYDEAGQAAAEPPPARRGRAPTRSKAPPTRTLPGMDEASKEA
jgi:exodeoxyribonuclease VII small subunit